MLQRSCSHSLCYIQCYFTFSVLCTHFYISTFRSMCAVPSTAFFVFGNSLISCFPGTLLRYYLNDFEMVPAAPIVTVITVSLLFVTFYKRCIFIVRSLYFGTLSASLLITLRSSEIATPISINVPFFIVTDCDVRFIVRDGCIYYYYYYYYYHHHHHHHHYLLYAGYLYSYS